MGGYKAVSDTLPESANLPKPLAVDTMMILCKRM